MPARLLSKTRYMNGLQCLKYLWLIYHEPEKVPAPDASLQHIFDQGHLIGELAKELFPDGIDVPDEDFGDNLNLTRQFLGERKTLFEAGFMADRLFSRLDVLRPSGQDGWDIVEVKSSTSLKDENLQDVAFQKLCCEKQGLQINECYLAFINNQYVKNGAIDPAQLFTLQNITREVEEAGEGIHDRIDSMLEEIANRQCPNISVGPYCRVPYDCPVVVCWEELPENNIFDLYRGGKRCFQMFREGILHIKDIPEGVKLSPVQQIQKKCEIQGITYVHKEALRDFLQTLDYPIYYLDFETFSPAVPLFDGTRPYQKIPFQYSLHVANEEGALRHYSYLARDTVDPRPELLHRLEQTVGPTGTIMTYNQSFENGVLQDLAQAFPEYGDWVEGACARITDLMAPFRDFHYYHPAQNGSVSLKAVLPALTGRSYAGMPIADGDAASRAYLDMIYGNLPDAEKVQIRADLEKYCGLDTEGMAHIVAKLQDICQR